MNRRWMGRRAEMRTLGRSHRALPSTMALVAAVLIPNGSTHGQNQVIPLRSGVAGANGADANVRVLTNGSPRDSAGAGSAPAALIFDPPPGTPTLPTDPTARWIGPATGRKMVGRTTLYAAPFTVNDGPIASADLHCVARGHGLGDRALDAELRVNGRFVRWISLGSDEHPEVPPFVEDIGPLLSVGVNWLQFIVPSNELDDGLIFSARVQIWSRTDFARPGELAHHEKTAGPSADVAAVQTAGLCGGFTCRPRGDLDSDQDVDLTDYIRFLECLSGVDGAPAGECEYADFGCDGVVDLADVGFFQTAFGGS